ncbi:hypothetical protein NDU88_002046 [Pleurodeles waltl]|uniref:Uncharacterized protein n=1 Tax=Pleurodeles waltl TaxID=8319 RepID=A0AAV7P5L0_PLEWA|nr:hypothetical protein NDU88_002046 [Pleurodeles waltl]
MAIIEVQDNQSILFIQSMAANQLKRERDDGDGGEDTEEDGDWKEGVWREENGEQEDRGDKEESAEEEAETGVWRTSLEDT